MLFHFIVVILWLHTKHDNKLIAMQATLSYAWRNIRYSVERRDNRSESATNSSKISGTDCFDFRVSTIPGQLQ